MRRENFNPILKRLSKMVRLERLRGDEHLVTLTGGEVSGKSAYMQLSFPFRSALFHLLPPFLLH